MSEPERQFRRISISRRLQVSFALLALVSVFTGFLIHLYARELGIDPLNADKIAFAFTAAGAIDAFVVYFWDDLIASIW